jgi:hypothetical protein
MMDRPYHHRRALEPHQIASGRRNGERRQFLLQRIVEAGERLAREQEFASLHHHKSGHGVRDIPGFRCGRWCSPDDGGNCEPIALAMLTPHRVVKNYAFSAS